MNPYKEELFAHAAIENWLSRGWVAGGVDSAFAFTVLTPGGYLSGLSGAGRFFERSARVARGWLSSLSGRPCGGVAGRRRWNYRERQQLPGGARTVRWSTVVQEETDGLAIF